ncbi:MAG: PEP/pyruvate-binding domain-containing protein [Bacteroidales bacterium]|nr:PEP/pyruvate-binding domain-containing protein [Bacteroidales bacterium]
MNIYQLGQLPEEIYPSVGGKAKGLDLLVRQGFTVPKGFVITDTDLIDEEAIYRAFDAMKAEKVSVRSSASNEDQSSASNAGQYETCLFVDRSHLMESVKKCLESLNSRRVEDYARHFELKQGTMNIVVQEMIDSDKAGVLFTAGPNNGSAILIEAVSGQGENLVSGQVTAHRYEISRKYYRPCSDDLLNEDEIKRLYETGKKIRTVFSEEKDLEWAIHNGQLYLLQMRPITTEIIDIEEFDRDDDLSGHLFTKRNVGEMMPGAVTPLTLSTSAKAIDYGMRYMLYKAGVYRSPYEEKPLRLISSISGHLFFDMNLLYNMYAKVGIANPQSMNLSIMGEYHDYPPITAKFSNPIVRGINSVKFLRYVMSGKRAMKRFDAMLTKVHFTETSSYQELYRSIDHNLAYLDESLIYHYASSSSSGSATSTLYMMLDKYFPDKKRYQSFLSHLLTNIPNIESADILSCLQEMAALIKKREPKAVDFRADELLEFIKNDAETNAKYQDFLARHGHRCIKEAEMRSKPWREDELPLMNYLQSIINSPMKLVQSEEKIDLRKEFAFIRNPLLKRASIIFAKRARQAVVDREYTKSQLIQIIDLFKQQYARLAKLMVNANILTDTDLIYFLTHTEIGKLIDGDTTLLTVAERRRKAYAIQENLSFDDIYIGKPTADVFDVGQNDGVMKGVPVSNGECEGIVRVVYSIDDANKLQKGEIMVARFTDIGWTPYYSIVNGMITEIGSSLSHGAVVAREYGLPAIVNMKGATKLLKNGDRIRMDAGKGTVVLAEAS